jgi:predicted porin
MKKTLLALSVLAAGSAQAGINLYDANNVIVDLSGAAEVQYIQEYTPNSDPFLRLDDGDLSLNTTIAVNDQLSIVSGMAFKFESRDVQNDELWVGFGGDFGTLTFGRQLLIADDSGIGKDYELGGDGLDWVVTEADQVVKYVYDNGQFYAGLSSVIKDNNFDNATSIVDGRIGARAGNLDARVYLYKGSDIDGNFSFLPVVSPLDQIDVEGYNLEVEYFIDAFALAASFGQLEYKDASSAKTGKVDADVAVVAGSYTMDKTTFALGYTYLNADAKPTVGAKSSADANTFYANVTQQLHSNAKVYGEIGTTDIDNSEFGYVVGMEVVF